MGQHFAAIHVIVRVAAFIVISVRFSPWDNSVVYLKAPSDRLLRRQCRDTNRNITFHVWCTADADSKVKRFERRPFQTLDFTIRVLAVQKRFYVSITKSVLLCI